MSDVDAAFFRDLALRAGEEVGVTEWFSVTQRDTDIFAALTDDWDFMHNSPEWGEQYFGSTIVHGYFVLAMIPSFSKQVLPRLPVVADGAGTVLNYGLNRVRFVTPLGVGRRARDHIRVLEVVERKPLEFLVTYEHTIEIEDEKRPFMVAESCAYYILGYKEKLHG